MRTLQLSKNDVRNLFAILALFPLLCFISGFFIADNFRLENRVENGNEEKKHHVASSEQELVYQQPEVVSGISKQREDVSVKFEGIEETDNNERVSTVELKSLNDRRSYVVQAGLFNKYENAKNFQLKLSALGLGSQIIVGNEINIPVYRVILSTFKSKIDAKQLVEHLEKKYQVELYVRLSGVESDIKKFALL